MTSQPTTTDSDVRAVAEAIGANKAFLVVTHENPDGDALGSMLAMSIALRRLGKDTVMYLSGEAPTPGEYRFLDLNGLRRALPDDTEERVLLALDCASERRIGPEHDVMERARMVVNVDHHHDNTRFGDVNLIVDDASATTRLTSPKRVLS